MGRAFGQNPVCVQMTEMVTALPIYRVVYHAETT